MTRSDLIKNILQGESQRKIAEIEKLLTAITGFFHFSGMSGANRLTYLRCSDEGIEPLVIRRGFHGIRPNYWEVSEEFRFYFNLYEDRRK